MTERGNGFEDGIEVAIGLLGGGKMKLMMSHNRDETPHIYPLL
jgi:hypothetical protein